MNANWLKESKGDVLQIFEEHAPCELERFENFDIGSDRVDTLGYMRQWELLQITVRYGEL